MNKNLHNVADLERIQSLEAELAAWKGAADVQKYRAEKAEEKADEATAGWSACRKVLADKEAEVERLQAYRRLDSLPAARKERDG